MEFGLKISPFEKVFAPAGAAEKEAEPPPLQIHPRAPGCCWS